MSARLTAILIALASLALNAAPAMTAQYAGTLSIVPNDVDVYDQPGGESKPRAESLKGQSQVYLQEQNADHWCKVAGDAVPGNVGWIWCGQGGDGKDYSLIPTAAPDTPAGAPAGAGSGGGGTPAAEPIKTDCKDFGPNEGSAGGASDPKLKYECEDTGNGNKRCCWVKYP